MSDERPKKTSRSPRGAKRRTENESAVAIAPGGDQNRAERVVPVPQTSELDARNPELDSELSARDAQTFDDTESEIRLRAYELYLSRGGSHGDDVTDWLEAERLVRSRGVREAPQVEHLLANPEDRR